MPIVLHSCDDTFVSITEEGHLSLYQPSDDGAENVIIIPRAYWPMVLAAIEEMLAGPDHG